MLAGVGVDWLVDLCEAVLLRAIKDLKETVDYSLAHSQKLGPEVRLWFASDDDVYPLSFLSCCSILKLDPGSVRRTLAPYQTPKNDHLADYTFIPGYFGEVEKVRYVRRKLERLCRTTMKRIQQESYGVMPYKETKSIVNSMLACGQVIAVSLWVRRNKRIFYEFPHPVLDPREPGFDEEPPENHEESGHRSPVFHQESVRL